MPRLVHLIVLTAARSPGDDEPDDESFGFSFGLTYIALEPDSDGPAQLQWLVGSLDHQPRESITAKWAQVAGTGTPLRARIFKDVLDPGYDHLHMRRETEMWADLDSGDLE